MNTVTTRRTDLHQLRSPEQKQHSQLMPTAEDRQKTPETDGPSYYNISLLQAPVWKWEIALYFWFGGISGGSYILGRVADRFGGGRYKQLSKLASYISFVSLLPSPPLLIYDLGDPKRFHHMLRVFKPSTPLWCKNTWIGPLFSSSAAATAAGAVNLALDLTGADEHGASKRAIERIETAAHLAEAATLVGYLREAGPLARPMTHGGQKRNLILTVVGLLAPELLKRLPLSGKPKRAASILGSLLSLAGGLALRWAFVYGGQESGGNPRDARLGSKPKPATENSGSTPQVSMAAAASMN